MRAGGDGRGRLPVTVRPARVVVVMSVVVVMTRLVVVVIGVAGRGLTLAAAAVGAFPAELRAAGGAVFLPGRGGGPGKGGPADWAGALFGAAHRVRRPAAAAAARIVSARCW